MMPRMNYFIIPSIPKQTMKELKENTANRIINIVCQEASEYGMGEITPEMIKVKNRKSNYLLGRQLSIYFINKYIKSLSLTQVGALFGQDHATVIHTKKKVSNLYDTERKYRELVEKINERLLATV